MLGHRVDQVRERRLAGQREVVAFGVGGLGQQRFVQTFDAVGHRHGIQPGSIDNETRGQFGAVFGA